uniref:Uncharacterized protein n=1 Tax=Tanacetum cinerariifolium TaxID=118510 RepID=A0A6L2M0S7_TANCI|nr:hypothetical protein [Tanacetum cinerariifolium]
MLLDFDDIQDDSDEEVEVNKKGKEKVGDEDLSVTRRITWADSWEWEIKRNGPCRFGAGCFNKPWMASVAQGRVPTKRTTAGTMRATERTAPTVSHPYPDVNPPSPEISNEEIFQAKGDLMKSIQTFLERFNCIPFEEKPQILFQTWETFFASQCSQPEDSNELFQKLLKDLKELAKYDQSTSTDRPIFLNDNEDHPIQNRESPENSSEEIVVSKTNQEPPHDSDIHQLIEECSIEVPEQQKQKMEDTMFDLVKICHHKQFLCIHDDVDNLIESALDYKLLSINSINSQCLDKKEQEVKNVVE